MFTRRKALTLATAGVAIAVVDDALAYALRNIPRADGAGQPVERFVPDRVLRLSLADRMTSQSWMYSGQSYIERRARVSGDEGECILLTIVNDTDAAQPVTFEGTLFAGVESPQVRLRAGQFATVELTLMDSEQRGAIRNGRHVLPVEVRPSYQNHALHLNF